MTILRTKEDVVEFARQHAPTNACARAIGDGKVMVLPLTHQLGWLVAVYSPASPRKVKWKIGVYCDEVKRTYSVKYL